MRFSFNLYHAYLILFFIYKFISNHDSIIALKMILLQIETFVKSLETIRSDILIST